MATKTSKLHTSFTGDDKQFQRTAGRVMKSGTQMGAMAGKLKGAFAAMGGAMVLSGIVEKFDRIGKVAKRVGMTAEEVQRLAHASKLAGTSFETLQAILTRLQRRIGEALQNPASAAAQAFNELGLSATALKDMGLKEQFFAVADAFKSTEGSVEGVASLMKLLDTEARNLIPLFQEGGTGIQDMMSSATVASNATVKALEKVSDKLTEINNKFTATAANIFVGAWDAFEKYANKVSVGAMVVTEQIKRDLGDPSALTPLEVAATATAIMTGKRLGTAGRELTQEEKATQAEEKRRLKLGEGLRAEMDQLQAEIRSTGMRDLLTERSQKKIKEAFADPSENPFAETLALLEEKWKPSELAKKKKEAEQRNLSGQFSEFMQTAGLGGTGYLRKTPEIVQLEKQTKISESMLQSLNEFNSSMGILVDNTVER